MGVTNGQARPTDGLPLAAPAVPARQPDQKGACNERGAQGAATSARALPSARLLGSFRSDVDRRPTRSRDRLLCEQVIVRMSLLASGLGRAAQTKRDKVMVKAAGFERAPAANGSGLRAIVADRGDE